MRSRHDICFNYDYLPQAESTARALRWLAGGKAKVTHEKYGSVIVPSKSNLTAVENAAEFWRCSVWEIIGTAKVELVPDTVGPVRRPREFCKSGGKRYEKKENMRARAG